jgi:hypothetical protein
MYSLTIRKIFNGINNGRIINIWSSEIGVGCQTLDHDDIFPSILINFFISSTCDRASLIVTLFNCPSHPCGLIFVKVIIKLGIRVVLRTVILSGVPDVLNVLRKVLRNITLYHWDLFC